MPSIGLGIRVGKRGGGSSGFPSTSFVITVDTTKAGSAANTFVLPTAGAGTYDYYVDWGEGGAEEYVTVNTSQTHVYAANGTYQIRIRGTFPRIYFNNAGDKLKLMTIDNWGNIAWSSMQKAFYGCSNMTGTYTDYPNTAAATSMGSMFQGCLVFNSPVNFNTAAVTNMDATFRECAAFNQSVASFNTAAVTSMWAMFYGCTVFNQSVANFNTAKVTSMSIMFLYCDAFNQSVANFDTALVTDMSSMFDGCKVFNQSVANFNTAKATNMSYMFCNCYTFNQSVANFNTAKVTTMSYMFVNCLVFNQSVANFDTALVTNMSYMFLSCTAFKQSLATFTMTSVTNVTELLNGCDINASGTATNYDATLVAWAAQDLVNSKAFHGGTSKYSAAGGGTAARAAIISDDLWTITDGGELV